MPQPLSPCAPASVFCNKSSHCVHGPHSRQLEKARTQQWRPSIAKISNVLKCEMREGAPWRTLMVGQKSLFNVAEEDEAIDNGREVGRKVWWEFSLVKVIVAQLCPTLCDPKGHWTYIWKYIFIHFRCWSDAHLVIGLKVSTKAFPIPICSEAHNEIQ